MPVGRFVGTNLFRKSQTRAVFGEGVHFTGEHSNPALEQVLLSYDLKVWRAPGTRSDRLCSDRGTCIFIIVAMICSCWRDKLLPTS